MMKQANGVFPPSLRLRIGCRPDEAGSWPRGGGEEVAIVAKLKLVGWAGKGVSFGARVWQSEPKPG